MKMMKSILNKTATVESFKLVFCFEFLEASVENAIPFE